MTGRGIYAASTSFARSLLDALDAPIVAVH
jgi:hypothetical protein